MNLTIEHKVNINISQIEKIILDPLSWENLRDRIPTLKEVKVLSREQFGDKIHMRKWFVPNITIPWFARGKVKREMLEWEETLIWSPNNHCGEFTIKPNIPKQWEGYFTCKGLYALHPQDSNMTRRVVSIDFEVKVPMVGGFTEKFIADQIKEWYDKEIKFLETIIK